MKLRKMLIILLFVLIKQYVQQGTVDSKSIESTFDLFDTNHNGMITSDELIAQILYIRSGVQIIPINLIQNTENDVNMV